MKERQGKENHKERHSRKQGKHRGKGDNSTNITRLHRHCLCHLQRKHQQKERNKNRNQNQHDHRFRCLKKCLWFFFVYLFYGFFRVCVCLKKSFPAYDQYPNMF